MALNFIKKVFSFGKKQVEEAPAEAPVAELPEQEVPETTAAPVVEEVAPPAGVIDAPETLPESEPESRADIEPEPERVSEPTAEEAAAAEALGIAGMNVRVEEEKERAEEEEEEEEVKPVSAEAETPAPSFEPDGERSGPEHSQPEPPPPVAESSAAESEDEPEDPATGHIAPPTLPSRQVRVGKAVSDAEVSVPEAPVSQESNRPGWWHRLRQGLARSSAQLSGQVTGIFTRRKLDEDTLQELEDVLIQADLGVETAMRITDTLASGRYGRDISAEEVSRVMAGEIEKALTPVAMPLELDLSHKPHIILVVGVNGTGKTTTIGKLAAKLAGGGLKVMLAAGDTFRAAAIEQLHIWGERTGAEVVSTKLGADAAGLAYEAIEAARQKGSDVLIIDTAGRLQNRTELMDELAKVVRVIGKLDPEAPHTVLQTLDATTGQNALNQVEIFHNVAGVNGLVMTKLDGTARGGILVAIAARHKLPVYFIGVGEGVDDLEPFEAHEFAAAIAGEAP